MLKRIFAVIIVTAVFASCGTSKKTATTDSGNKTDNKEKTLPEPQLYRA